jgi:hypothetical protein
VSKTVRVPDPVYDQLEAIAKDHDMSMKEAVRSVLLDAGYEV